MAGFSAWLAKMFGKAPAPSPVLATAIQAVDPTPISAAKATIGNLVTEAEDFAETSVSSIASKLGGMISELEAHAASKLAEVEAHASAEAASLEAKLAASKEVEDAKSLIAKIKGLIAHFEMMARAAAPTIPVASVVEVPVVSPSATDAVPPAVLSDAA